MQQEIKTAKEEAHDAYFEKEKDATIDVPGIKAAMIIDVAKCREGLKSKFNKLIGIADPEHTSDFLEEVKLHYATNAKLEMLQEKTRYW